MKAALINLLGLVMATMAFVCCNRQLQIVEEPCLGLLLADSLTSTSVVLKADLYNASAVKECGILIEGMQHTASIGGSGIRCRIEGLAPSRDYTAVAFITNGRNTHNGDPLSFRTKDQFPDATFRAWALTNYDSDGDGLITDSETSSLERLEVPSEIGYGIQSTEGIEVFKGIRYLWLSGSWEGKTAFKSLDISSFNKLSGIYAPFGVMDNIQLPAAVTKMDHISLDYQNLTVLDFKTIRELDILQVAHNKLTSLDLSGFSKIRELHCDDNDITELDLSSLDEIELLICYQNPRLERIILKKGLVISQLEKDEHTRIEYSTPF